MSSEERGLSAEQPARRGRLFVVSAPSGTGKTRLVERLVRRVPDLVESRSYTSRPARDGEQDGVDYNFISRKRFEEMVGRGAFLEWADVFGKLYGTAKVDTEAHLERRLDVVLVIDVQGARQLRANGVEATSIFVLPPSPDVLETRLRGRSQDSEAQIRRRLVVARDEVLAFSEYDYLVVNDEFDSAVERLKGIVLGCRAAMPGAATQGHAIASRFGLLGRAGATR